MGTRKRNYQHFSPEVRQRAFELWWSSGRDLGEARRRLQKELGRDDLMPKLATLNSWRQKDQWHEKANLLDESRLGSNESFTGFKRYVWKDYQHAPHLELLDTALTDAAQAVENRDSRSDVKGLRRLMIFMPPRHGKSLTVARLFPAWFLGRNPDKRVMLTAYASHLVEMHSRFTRNLIRSDPYRDIFPDVKIARDSSSRVSWDIAGRSGGLQAGGMYGGIMGKGAHLLIVDDPVQSRLRIESAKYREGQWETYQSDIYSRLEPNGAIVVIMTRWHEDDLAGRLLKQNPDGWTVIRLPAIAEEDSTLPLTQPTVGTRHASSVETLDNPITPDSSATSSPLQGELVRTRGVGGEVNRSPGDWLGRSVGEALWAERYSVEALREIQRDVGPIAWASLYQQRPIHRENGLFKSAWVDDRRNQVVPPLKRTIIAIDPAGASGEGSAETGILAVGIDYQKPPHAWVLEDVSLRGTPDAWSRAALEAYKRWEADSIVVEVNQGGEMVGSTLRTINPNVRIKQVRATKGKAIRAEPVAALYEQGRVHHAGVFAELEDQMTRWTPGDASPDRLDALVWGLTDLVIEPRGVGLR